MNVDDRKGGSEAAAVPATSPGTGAPAGREPRVGGIVLAAGRSARMGRPKAEMTFEGQTFLERCLGLLRAGGCDPVVVVVPDAGHAAAKERKGVLWAVNGEPESEQIDSLRIGLSTLPPECEAALVLPVDAPAVRLETVRQLLERFQAAGPQAAHVVRPVHAGKPGHPTLFSRAVFGQLQEPGLTHGAETIVQRHSATRIDVVVEDRGIMGNVNTPDDYQRLVQGT